MATHTEKIGKKLNSLLEKTYDAESNFGKAAEDCDNRGLADYFNKKALQRRNFAKEIKNEIISLGLKVEEEEGSFSGDVRRTWMDIETFFSKNDDGIMLKEAIRSENLSLDEYSDILEDHDLPASTAVILRNQLVKLKAGLNIIKGMEDIKEK